MSNKIIDSSGDKKYFTVIPNCVDDMNLTVYAYRLYGHLKRVAGDSGACWQSTRTLAEKCNMSPMAVSRAKKELEQAGLISVEMTKSQRGGKDYHTVTIKDIWDKNITYSKQVPVEDEQVSNRYLQVPTGYEQVPTEIRKKNPLIITHEEEDKTKNASTPSTFYDDLFFNTTGFMIPGSAREKVMDALNGLQLQGKASIAYLMPFWRAWKERYTSKTNCAWLYDWAATGEIPNKTSGTKTNSKPTLDAAREAARLQQQRDEEETRRYIEEVSRVGIAV